MSHATHTAELERRLMGAGVTGPEIKAIREAHGVTVPPPALLAAGGGLTTRLLILQKLQAQYRDMKQTMIELDVAELFEPGDAAAIESWESAKAAAMGQVPLPMEIAG